MHPTLSVDAQVPVLGRNLQPFVRLKNETKRGSQAKCWDPIASAVDVRRSDQNPKRYWTRPNFVNACLLPASTKPNLQETAVAVRVARITNESRVCVDSTAEWITLTCNSPALSANCSSRRLVECTVALTLLRNSACYHPRGTRTA